MGHEKTHFNRLIVDAPRNIHAIEHEVFQVIKDQTNKSFFNSSRNVDTCSILWSFLWTRRNSHSSYTTGRFPGTPQSFFEA
ncbi:hypothetical protein PAXRUDRAFT_836477 [Paxillus rubicundulus Ve08.2h10]|uniref:Uncharacterized protein n=1 Tax=Paxillus rubicundulus Ve08.2h10 TaxID=930991 RepID=A0A0D0C9Y7_9AGAM|nr:hypothetical protein PAXRUDRAFT_836477 [Paxillus rubicundulus Ve08.2h10]